MLKDLSRGSKRNRKEGKELSDIVIATPQVGAECSKIIISNPCLTDTGLVTVTKRSKTFTKNYIHVSKEKSWPKPFPQTVSFHPDIVAVTWCSHQAILKHIFRENLFLHS